MEKRGQERVKIMSREGAPLSVARTEFVARVSSPAISYSGAGGATRATNGGSPRSSAMQSFSTNECSTWDVTMCRFAGLAFRAAAMAG